uniref:Uncharacterized protein n=1 Tax=Anguilla anguilla TaxID=7936 RepID=A0A0E9SHD5_ANGAN
MQPSCDRESTAGGHNRLTPMTGRVVSNWRGFLRYQLP